MVHYAWTYVTMMSKKITSNKLTNIIFILEMLHSLITLPLNDSYLASDSHTVSQTVFKEGQMTGNYLSRIKRQSA